MTATQHKSFAAADCDITFDNLTRQLYATDASIYQIVPAAVAFPRSAQQASAAIRAAADAGVSVTPRGAGSGLAGGAIGDGLIVEFSRFNRQISGRDLEQCNGCGGCRKDVPTMGPTFLTTGDEYLSTRGRANAIRAALELRTDSHDPLRSGELEKALSTCLSCKACTTECPSNVNMALLKAELLYARHRRDGLPLRERMLSAVDLLGRLGCVTPSLANAALDFPPIRELMSNTLGISPKRPLPHYTHERFDKWFRRRGFRPGSAGASPAVSRAPRDTLGNVASSPRCRVSVDVFGEASKTAGGAPALPGSRGRVILWDDPFVRCHEPKIGIDRSGCGAGGARLRSHPRKGPPLR